VSLTGYELGSPALTHQMLPTTLTITITMTTTTTTTTTTTIIIIIIIIIIITILFHNIKSYNKK